MPFIQVKLVEEALTPSQKRQLITKLTDAMAEFEGENVGPVSWVVIDEVRGDEWGAGGETVTSEDMHALAAGRK
jgi:4-oxalocrotonate tautomerase